jgi:hypothetical protein
MGFESSLTGAEALEVFLAVSRMNVKLFESLSDGQRRRTLSHPEYGELTVDWVVHQMAGHQIHHLRQLERIGRQDQNVTRSPI